MMADNTVPLEIDERKVRRLEHDQAVRELKAMTKKQRLEACRSFVETVRARNNDVYVSFYPPWMHEGKVMVGQTCGDTDHTKPEPKYYFHDFTVEELVAVLDPLGNVHRLQDKMPWHFRERWDYPYIDLTAADLPGNISEAG